MDLIVLEAHIIISQIKDMGSKKLSQKYLVRKEKLKILEEVQHEGEWTAPSEDTLWSSGYLPVIWIQDVTPHATPHPNIISWHIF